MAGVGGWSPTPVTCWTWRQSGFSINLSLLSMCVLEWPAVGMMVLMVLMMWEDWSPDDPILSLSVSPARLCERPRGKPENNWPPAAATGLPSD